MKLGLALVNRPSTHEHGPVRHAFGPDGARMGRGNTLCGIDARRGALGDETVFDVNHPRSCPKCAAAARVLYATEPAPLRQIEETSA